MTDLKPKTSRGARGALIFGGVIIAAAVALWLPGIMRRSPFGLTQSQNVTEERSSMTAEQFIVLYEQALGTQQWTSVEPLIHQEASVTFSTGAVHKGKEAVRSAFEENFSVIEDEEYRISNVHWVLRDANVAAYLFDYRWAGRIDGRDAAGSGRGTAVLVLNSGNWQLIAEHLGPAPR